MHCFDDWNTKALVVAETTKHICRLVVRNELLLCDRSVERDVISHPGVGNNCGYDSAVAGRAVGADDMKVSFVIMNISESSHSCH